MRDAATPGAIGDVGPLRALLGQYGKFLLVGCGATLVHISAFVLLIALARLAPLWANFAAYLAAFLGSFLGNFAWTFAGRVAWSGALGRFLVISLLGLGINTAIVYAVTEVAAASYLYAVALMGLVTPVLTFVLSRQWGFKPAA